MSCFRNSYNGPSALEEVWFGLAPPLRWPRCDRGCDCVTAAIVLVGCDVRVFSSFIRLVCCPTISLMAVRSFLFASKSFSLSLLSLHPAMNLKAVRSSLFSESKSAMSPAVQTCDAGTQLHSPQHPDCSGRIPAFVRRLDIKPRTPPP